MRLALLNFPLGFCLLACTAKSANTDGPPEQDLSVRAAGDLAGSKDLATSSEDLAGRDLSVTPVDLAGRDLSVTPVDLAGRDLSVTPDLSQPTSAPAVRCGGSAAAPALCTPQMAVCCSSNDGQSGTCVSTPNACPSGVPYTCDQPADCAAGQVCCQTTGVGQASAGSKCLSAAACTAQTGKALCRTTSDCNGEICCSFAVGSQVSYLYCTSGICPASAAAP